MIEAAMYAFLFITVIVVTVRQTHMTVVIDGLCAQLADLQETRETKENPHAL